MSKHIKNANKIIVIVAIILLLIITGVVGYEYMNANDLSFLDIKQEILLKIKR